MSNKTTPRGEFDSLNLNVQPIEFNSTTHDLLPSISPRDKLEHIEDRKLLKTQNKFLDSNRLLNKFTILLQAEILKAKPDNILDFIIEEFFSDENIKKIKFTLI
jgi:hypothetical protein